ncbi:VOC family protein [Weeksellaceae bacterium KMM 9713]|uniref:VOC family protein n=1 Tax=Profundicola chukchiensis TaxID=2961959 RepID=A0A9X4N0G9_9FLAO|nr:VOC family protein [Profundicola chukchiensis]MDG4946442.1 VOC family protein [Profundicola chukchiensis]
MSNSKEPKVTGIGGIFFFSDNVQETKDWYSKNLGFNTDQWGATFASRNINKPDEVNYLQWSPFQSDTKYFEPSKKEFMINYRVQNLDALLVKLKENNVEILGEVQSYDYGRFVHIIDPEGNKIELWEPIDDELVK